MLRRISDKIVFLPPDSKTDRPILAAISGAKRTLIVDGGNSPAHAELFLHELNKNDVNKIDLLVVTHWHWDHVFGIGRMNVPTIAHSETKRQIDNMLQLSWTDDALDQRVQEGTEISFCAEMIKKEFPDDRKIVLTSPDIVFSGKLDLDLGGVHCVIEHVGGDHASDSCIVYVEEEKVIFLGDCLYQDVYSKKMKYTTQNTLDMLQKLEQYHADIYVLSHEMPLSRSQYLKFVDLLKELCALSQESLSDKKTTLDVLAANLKRDLDEEDMETIQYFLNGLE